MLIGSLATVCGFLLWHSQLDAYEEGSVRLQSLLAAIEDNYIGDVDLDAVYDAALAGAVAGLDDRWSYYMTAEEYASYQDYTANQYKGIGVTIVKDDETGGFSIVSVSADSPAAEAGLEAGDIILAVDGTDVTTGGTAELKALISADYESEALITVLRPDGATEDVSVLCRDIASVPVSYELLDGSVGYVRIENFESGAASAAKEAVNDLLAQGALAFVLDVRDNPGGYVSEMVELLDLFLPEGDVFVRVDKDGTEQVETSDAYCLDYPLAVLINENSISAAEFFAAALDEYEVAVTVGQPTTGKSRSQITIELADGGALHISRYRYYTPNRVDLAETGGLVPDVSVELPEDREQSYLSGLLAPADDAQVQTAADLLRSALQTGNAA